MTPAATCHELGPLRILTAWLPLPACVEACTEKRHADGCTLWTKHTRIDKTREGRRYLVPPARLYRAGVVKLVRPLLPRRPWFAGDRPWFVSLVQYMDGRKFDDDQWLGGVRDDLVEAGLAEDDAAAETSRVVRRKDGPGGLWVIASQEGWGA